MSRPVEYLPTETFVSVWIKYETLDEIYEEIARLCREAGKRPMSKPSIAAKAANLRNAGYHLNRKKRGKKTRTEAEEMNKFIAALQAAKVAGKDIPIPKLERVPQPPEFAQDPAETIKAILAEMRSKKV